ncbi:hypothetical protein AAG570_010022 [Ranatra chinensis]|uniref:Transposase n=1 Tax=Ranatra chinensis TaxID=642074 RepID=A0ABD0YNI6_9HEMI
MTKMVAEELAWCKVCARAKYVRTPQETPQMVTPTPEKPLEVVEADSVFLDEAIRLTLIDLLTRFAYNYPLQAKTGKRVRRRALLAYNSSLHSATGYTPLELMRAWQREDSRVSIQYVCGELVDYDDRKTRDRVDRLNIKATYRWNRVQAGDYVFIKNWYRRRKTDPQFVGPYIVDTKLLRFRLKVKCVETGRVRVIHANESRPPRTRQP